jgi:hypothetical protein
MERDEGGVGGGVPVRRFVEQMERVGVEAALDVGVQEGVGRCEGLGRVELAGLEEDSVERGGERRVASPCGSTKEADGGGSGGSAATSWGRGRGRGRARSGERQHRSSTVNGLVLAVVVNQ